MFSGKNTRNANPPSIYQFPELLKTEIGKTWKEIPMKIHKNIYIILKTQEKLEKWW